MFVCLYFLEFVIMELFAKSGIRESSISTIGSANNKKVHEILKFANLSSSWK